LRNVFGRGFDSRRLHTSGLPKSSVANWQRSLRKLFELAGVEKRHAHRMRVTMAVEQLKRGVSVENVVAILRNTPLIVQKHLGAFRNI